MSEWFNKAELRGQEVSGREGIRGQWKG